MPMAASPSVLPERIRAFLDAPRYATLSTVAPDGAPHQAVIWYTLDGDDLLINSRRERHWPRNLLHDPRMSLAITDADQPTHWIGVKGRASLIREGAAAVGDIEAMARRYDGTDGGRFTGQDRVTYRVHIDSTFEYGD